MIRVKVYGPSASHPFGVDIFIVEKFTDVSWTPDGVLVVATGPTEERPRPHDPTKMIPATRGSRHCYPRGGWTKVIVEDVVSHA